MIVASLAAMKARQETLVKVLESILAQSRPPDRIDVHYSEEPWHLDAGWPEPPRVPHHASIELRKVPNIGSMRKYIFTAREERRANSTIILLDDDRVWHPSVFQRLVSFVHDTDDVATTRGWSRYGLTPNRAGEPILRARAIGGEAVKVPTEVSVPNSGWATCFRAGHVDEQLFDAAMHEALDMRYSDEIALAAMLRRRKHVLPMPAGYCADLRTDVHQWLSARSTQAKLKQLAHFNFKRQGNGQAAAPSAGPAKGRS